MSHDRTFAIDTTDPELFPMLNAWMEVVQTHHDNHSSPMSPWWTDHHALVRTWAEAATRIGWESQLHFHPANDSSWDMELTSSGSGHGFALRMMSALQSIADDGDSQNTIHQCTNLALRDAVGLNPGDNRERLALTFVIPYARDSVGDDAQVATLMAAWLARTPFQLLNDARHAYAYSFANAGPIPRNASGWGFPGVGMIVVRCP
jgi:hypothetical protein